MKCHLLTGRLQPFFHSHGLNRSSDMNSTEYVLAIFILWRNGLVLPVTIRLILLDICGQSMVLVEAEDGTRLHLRNLSRNLLDFRLVFDGTPVSRWSIGAWASKHL